MGSQKSMHLIQHPLPKDYKSNPFHPHLYTSIINKLKLQKHTIQISNKEDLLYQQQMFIFRKCHCDHLIAAKYFQNISSAGYCSKNYQVCYYTQYPQCRFNEIQSLPFDEGLLYLIDALKGFSILSKKVGWFRVIGRMIAFDHLHKVKVWLSDNYSQTKLPKQRILKSQPEFITKIISIFDNKVINTQKCYTKIIQKHISQNNQFSINSCVNFLIKLVQQKTQQKDLFKSIKNLHKGEKEITKLKGKNNKKQKSLKRNKKIQQGGTIIVPSSYAQNTTKQFTNNQTNYQTPPNQIIFSNLSHGCTFNFQPKNLQTNLNYLQTIRHEKKILSQQKKLIQNKRIRKSMDQYQIHKANLSKLINRQIANQRAIVNRPTHINNTPYLHIEQNKTQYYERPSTKNNKQQKYNNPQITQKYIPQNDTINPHQMENNNNQLQQKLKSKQNIIISNLTNSNAIILGQLNTIKSINCSDMGNQQKPQSVIIYKQQFHRTTKLYKQ